MDPQAGWVRGTKQWKDQQLQGTQDIQQDKVLQWEPSFEKNSPDCENWDPLHGMGIVINIPTIPAPRRMWSKIWDQKEQNDERSLGHPDTSWNWRFNKYQKRHLDRSEPLDPSVTHIPDHDWFTLWPIYQLSSSLIKIKKNIYNILKNTIILSWSVLLDDLYHLCCIHTVYVCIYIYICLYIYIYVYIYICLYCHICSWSDVDPACLISMLWSTGKEYLKIWEYDMYIRKNSGLQSVGQRKSKTIYIVGRWIKNGYDFAHRRPMKFLQRMPMKIQYMKFPSK